MNISLTLTISARNLPALADALSAANLLDDVEVATKPAPVSATVTPEKQAAAIESAKKGTAAPKPPKNPETPFDALKQAVEGAKPVRTYEASGLAQKIAKAAAKDKPATVALLEKFNSRDAEGKLTGKALKVDQFDAFEADIDALLAAETALG
jgi:hypothetical protein